MSGLTNEGGGGQWLTVLYGKITKRVDAGTEGSKARVNKAGTTVHELQFNTLEGRLEKIYVQEHENRKSWVFVVDTGDKTYNLTVPYSSGYANGLLSRLPNVDFSDNVKIKSYWIKGDDDVERGYLTFKKGEAKIAPYYTKENPKDLPSMEQIEVKGNLVWDDTKRLKFYEGLVEKVNARIEKENPLIALSNEESESVKEEVGEAPAQEEETDLPF